MMYHLSRCNFMVTQCLILLILLYPGVAMGLTVGSNTTVAVENFTLFPISGNSTNEVLGFTVMSQGLALEDGASTCVYNAYFPVEQTIALGGGTLTLDQDLALTNTTNMNGLVVNAGAFVGANGQSIKFPTALNPLKIPFISFVPNLIASATASTAINSIDWSLDGQYIAAAISVAGPELVIFYFDGATLTTTNSLDTFNTPSTQGGQAAQQTGNCTRWHPTSKAFNAVATTNDLYDDFFIADFTTYNGKLISTDGGYMTADTYALAWHPSGRYLLAGGDNTANARALSLFGFNPSTGLLGKEMATDLYGIVTQAITPPDRWAGGADAISWAPGGSLFAIGTTRPSAATTLLVYNFNSSPSISLNASIDPGAAVQALDWSPTGTYIATGLAGTNEISVFCAQCSRRYAD